MQILTIGGFKGGTGKTTLAALIGVAAAEAGLRTAALDLDLNTRNLTHFLATRRAAKLAGPDHVMVLDLETPGQRRRSGRLEPFARMAQLDGYDLLIIDTSSGNLADVYEAHLLADAVLTPMNESPADLHGLFTPAGAPQAPKINYRELMDNVRFDRRRSGRAPQNWHICVNRVPALPTRIGAAVAERIEAVASQAGISQVLRVRDRVAHRAISLDGRTVFDVGSGRLTMSELSGRSEIRALLGVLDDRRIAPGFKGQLGVQNSASAGMAAANDAIEVAPLAA